MSEERSTYLSYVLRLWRSSSENERWLASLTDPVSGQRFGFGSLEALFGYLREQVGRQSAEPPGKLAGDG